MWYWPVGIFQLFHDKIQAVPWKNKHINKHTPWSRPFNLMEHVWRQKNKRRKLTESDTLCRTRNMYTTTLSITRTRCILNDNQSWTHWIRNKLEITYRDFSSESNALRRLQHTFSAGHSPSSYCAVPTVATYVWLLNSFAFQQMASRFSDASWVG